MIKIKKKFTVCFELELDYKEGYDEEFKEDEVVEIIHNMITNQFKTIEDYFNEFYPSKYIIKEIALKNKG